MLQALGQSPGEIVVSDTKHPVLWERLDRHPAPELQGGAPVADTCEL